MSIVTVRLPVSHSLQFVFSKFSKMCLYRYSQLFIFFMQLNKRYKIKTPPFYKFTHCIFPKHLLILYFSYLGFLEKVSCYDIEKYSVITSPSPFSMCGSYRFRFQTFNHHCLLLLDHVGSNLITIVETLV